MAAAPTPTSASKPTTTPNNPRMPFLLFTTVPLSSPHPDAVNDPAAPVGRAGGGGNAAKFPLRFVVEELGPVAEPPAGRRDDRQGRHGEADHARPAQGRV